MSEIDHWNLFVYYQHFHKKRVLAGYVRNMPLTRQFYFDGILQTLNHQPEKLKFSNMIRI